SPPAYPRPQAPIHQMCGRTHFRSPLTPAPSLGCLAVGAPVVVGRPPGRAVPRKEFDRAGNEFPIRHGYAGLLPGGGRGGSSRVSAPSAPPTHPPRQGGTAVAEPAVRTAASFIP